MRSISFLEANILHYISLLSPEGKVHNTFNRNSFGPLGNKRVEIVTGL
jgi:hypothetical protein